MHTQSVGNLLARATLLGLLALLAWTLAPAAIPPAALASVTEETAEDDIQDGTSPAGSGTSEPVGVPSTAMTCAELVDKHHLSLNLASYWSTRPGNQGYVNKFLDYAAGYLSEATGKGCFSAA